MQRPRRSVVLGAVLTTLLSCSQAVESPESPGRPGPRLEGALRVRTVRVEVPSPPSTSDPQDPSIYVQASAKNISDEVVRVKKCRAHWRFTRDGRRVVWRPSIWLRPGEKQAVSVDERPGSAYWVSRYRVRCIVTGWVGAIPEPPESTS
jgi:hypothetical protein